AAGERAGRQADRFLQGTDRGAGGAAVQVVQAGPGTEAEAVARAEGVAGIVEQDADVPAGPVSDHDVRPTVAVNVGKGDVGGRDAHGAGDGWGEPAGRHLERHGHAVVQRIGRHQVVKAVAGKVCGGDPRRQEVRGKGRGAFEPAL